MLMPGETFSATYQAVAEAVPTARQELTDFARRAGAEEERLQAVRLACSEAITNVVMHAYEPSQRGEVQINASYVEDELWVLVADSGHGLRPRENSPGLGLGLALVAQLADEFQMLSRGCGGTELRMRFDLCADRPPRGPAEGWKRARRRCGSTPIDRRLIARSSDP
jgi:serine/threonine-protein kinase RsbW